MHTPSTAPAELPRRTRRPRRSVTLSFADGTRRGKPLDPVFQLLVVLFQLLVVFFQLSDALKQASFLGRELREGVFQGFDPCHRPFPQSVDFLQCGGRLALEILGLSELLAELLADRERRNRMAAAAATVGRPAATATVTDIVLEVANA